MKYSLHILLFAIVISTLFGCSKDEEKTTKQPPQESSKVEKSQAFEAIKSLPRVIQGYKSFYSRWPQSIQDFDNGEYFFDSNYMADSIARGFTVYLALTDDAAGFKLWVLPERSKAGYRLTDDSKNLTEITADLLQTEVDSNYLAEGQKGMLIFLTAKKNQQTAL